MLGRIPQTQLESFQRCLAEQPMKKVEMVEAAINHLGGEATTFEVADLLRWSVHCVSGKITVLQDQGRVRDTGRTKPHNTRNSKREVAVWQTGKFEMRDKMTKAEMLAYIRKLELENKELRAQLGQGWEEVQREVCRQCNGKGYIESQQGKFDI